MVIRICSDCHIPSVSFQHTDISSTVLLLTYENEILAIIYSLFRDRQNIFLAIFSTKFVIKCATKI